MGAWASLRTPAGTMEYVSLVKLEKESRAPLSRLPYATRVLIESVARHVDGHLVRDEDLREALASAQPGG